MIQELAAFTVDSTEDPARDRIDPVRGASDSHASVEAASGGSEGGGTGETNSSQDSQGKADEEMEDSEVGTRVQVGKDAAKYHIPYHTICLTL
jgi:hypothetical protein